DEPRCAQGIRAGSGVTAQPPTAAPAVPATPSPLASATPPPFPWRGCAAPPGLRQCRSVPGLRPPARSVTPLLTEMASLLFHVAPPHVSGLRRTAGRPPLRGERGPPPRRATPAPSSPSRESQTGRYRGPPRAA